MNLKLLFLIIAALMSQGSCFAWGIGTHLYHGGMVVLSPATLIPVMAEFLSKYSTDYLYGIISADFHIGKGLKQHLKHCHHWDMSKKIVENAASEKQKAFAYGYMSHLAADVVAHNFFVPSFINRKSVFGKKMNHIYWEVIADSIIPISLWRHLQTVAYHHHSENDELMNRVLEKNIYIYKLKRYIYKKSIELHNFKIWQQQVERMKDQYEDEIIETIHYFQRLAYCCVLDVLNNQFDSIVMNYDPMGPSPNIFEYFGPRVSQTNVMNSKNCQIVIPTDLRDLEQKYPKTERVMVYK